MEINHLSALCNHVSDFGARENWRFKAMPVIVWEFASINDFMDARVGLERMLIKTPPYTLDALLRSPAPHLCEIDCCGITFRLVCREVLMTEHGPYGAAEITPIVQPDI